MSRTEQYNKGDKIRFLNEVGGGTITRVLNDGSIMVETEDGFEYPAMPDEIVLIEKRTKNLNQKTAEQKHEKTEPEKLKIEEERNDYRILIAFVKDKNAKSIMVFLINDSPYFLNFAFYKRPEGEYNLISQDVLEPDTKLEITNIPEKDIDDLKKIALQGIFTGNKLSEIKPAIKSEIKIKPVKLIKEETYEQSDYFNEKAVIYEIHNNKSENKTELSDVIIEKEIQDRLDYEKSKMSKKKPAPVIWEEDLHINELVESVVGMSNHEILTYQMNHFHKILNKAINEKVDAVVFIHGIGNGTLKTTLRKSLKDDYNLYFEDASFKEYGFGATKVYPGKSVFGL